MANKRPKQEEIVTELRQAELLPKGERLVCGLHPQRLERPVNGRRGPFTVNADLKCNSIAKLNFNAAGFVNHVGNNLVDCN
jgi:hypothetical protein